VNLPGAIPIRRRVFSRAACLLGAVVTLALSGCAGFRFRVPEDPLTLLGDGAALYGAFPVVPNRSLLDAIAGTLENLSDKDRESLQGLLDRTQFVRVAYYGDRSIRLALTGDFPRAAAPFVFPDSGGWKRVKGGSGAVWHARGDVSAAMPANGIVCVALGGGIESMLAPMAEPMSYPPVSEALTILSAGPEGARDIALCLVDPQPVLPLVIGADVSLPLERADIIARPAEDGSTYALDLSFTAADSPRARAMAVLLRLLSGLPTEVSGTEVRVRTEDTKAETLAGFASFLIF